MTDIFNIKTKRSLQLQTSCGNHIDNEQYCGLTRSILFEKSVEGLKNNYPNLIIKNQPTDCYNCHGMTFASRRTGIYESTEVNKILKEDKYQNVESDNVLPGDIILYYSSDGDIEHSGLVIEVNKDLLKIPIILSKWGMTFEVIHSAYICPYDMNDIRFYRCFL